MIIPGLMTYEQWSDAITHSLFRYGHVEVPPPEGDWQEWAEGLTQIPAIASQGCPDPYFFNDWREWAHRFAQVVTIKD